MTVSTGDALGKLEIRNNHVEKIRAVLAESPMPMDVENVRMKTGLKNWESTKAILLEMVLQGVVQGERTTRGWIFWLNSARKGSRRLR